jgi:cyclopropane fatty-acyl-phospholipid synthase-like methyltransferase
MNVITKKPQDWTEQNIADFWDWHSKSISMQNQYFASVMAPGIVKYLKKKGLLKGNVLDYGCGAGHLLEQMVKVPNVAFYGLDFSDDSITETQKRTLNKANLKQLVTVNKLPSTFSNNSFNTISLIETIEHLQDDKLHETLDELYRLLKSKGKLFITTPFNEDLNHYMHFCPFCKTEFHHMQHMQSFDAARLTALAKQHKFSVDYCNNIDIERLRLGAIKYFIKSNLKKMVRSMGLMEKIAEQRPNLIAILSKP